MPACQNPACIRNEPDSEYRHAATECPFPTEPSATDRELIAMLTENTGTHFLDSGGAYGRNWERDQSRQFTDEPASTVEFDRDDRNDGKYNSIMVTHNVFHWLSERVDYSAEMDAAWLLFTNLPENVDDSYSPALMERFPHWLAGTDGGAWQLWGDAERRDWHTGELVDQTDQADNIRETLGAIYEDRDGEPRGEAQGIYGDGRPFTVNTYNGEDLLSQTLQFTYWEEENGESYILLQIHGGADVRGGYTRPRVFRAGIEEWSILDNARAGIGCQGSHVDENAPRLDGTVPAREFHSWMTDDGVHYYDDGVCGAGYVNLENREWRALPDIGDVFLQDDISWYPWWERGVVFVDESSRGFCPYCGTVLSASSY